MKFLPSIDNPNLYGWIVLLIMLAAAVLAAIVVYVGSLLFGKKRRHKSRRRRGYSPPGQEVARTNGAPSALNRENAQGEPRS
jgi:uncharacterized membrane protein